MINIQYDFFDERPTEIEELKMGLSAVVKLAEKTYITSEKVRKSLYAKDGRQDKRLDELEERLARLEKNICTPAI